MKIKQNFDSLTGKVFLNFFSKNSCFVIGIFFKYIIKKIDFISKYKKLIIDVKNVDVSKG